MKKRIPNGKYKKVYEWKVGNERKWKSTKKQSPRESHHQALVYNSSSSLCMKDIRGAMKESEKRGQSQ